MEEVADTSVSGALAGVGRITRGVGLAMVSRYQLG